MTGRRTLLITGGYIAIMFFTLVVFYLLPIGNLYKYEMNQNEIINSQKEAAGLHSALYAGKLDSIYDKYKIGTVQYPFHDNKLEILFEGEPENVNIFIEKKLSNDHTIDIVQYQTKTIFDRVDYSEKVGSLKTALEGNKLRAFIPQQKDINIVKFQKEFTIVQFTDGKWFGERIGLNRGQHFIYLRIPPNVQLIYDEYKANVVYVNR